MTYRVYTLEGEIKLYVMAFSTQTGLMLTSEKDMAWNTKSMSIARRVNAAVKKNFKINSNIQSE
jgi:hypothetical protein